MKDAACITFLQWALPQLEMRWPGFRKVRHQVCKRIARRMKELGLETLEQYRARLDDDPGEWRVLDAACRITISRFYRDRHVFDILGEQVLPSLAEVALEEKRPLRCWCAGCASGEEVYSLAILWATMGRPAHADIAFSILGTDASPVMIERAERGCYSPGSLKDMPREWLTVAFSRSDAEYCVKPRYRKHTSFQLKDIREAMPEGPFDLILCRNLVLTYFGKDLQRALLNRIKGRLRPGGYMVIGAHETLPGDESELEPIAGAREIFRFQKLR